MKKLIHAFLIATLALLSPASGQLMLMTGAGLGSASTLDAFDLSYVTEATDTAGASTYSFAATNVGTDVTGANVRYTVVGIAAREGVSNLIFSSGTICGVAATAAEMNDSSGTNNSAMNGIMYANTSGQGASCTISFTLDNGATSGRIAVWRLINPTSGTPTDTTCNKDTGGGTALTLDTTISSGGAAAGIVSSRITETYTWSGLSEDFDSTIDGDLSSSGAHGGSAGSPASISATGSASSSNATIGCVASWAP